MLLYFPLLLQDVANIAGPGALGAAVELAHTHCRFVALAQLQQQGRQQDAGVNNSDRNTV